MTVEVPPWTAQVARSLPYPLIFATVSGAHLYGFASADSDLDVRACHLLPAAEVVGLRPGPETLQSGGVRDGVELDVVSHDLLKFARLLNSRNGYVLEQLLSPLVVVTGEVHRALAELVPGLLRAELEQARDASPLPERADPAAVAALHDLLVRTRLGSPAPV